MNLETLQVISSSAIVAGMIIAALGGFGQFYFGKKIIDKKEKSASERESKLHTEISNLSDKLEPFEKLAKQSYPDADINIALDRLKEDVEKLKDQSAELRVKIQNRNLSRQQKDQLVSQLRLADIKTISIQTILGDQESSKFGSVMREVFQEAGWHVTDVHQAVYDGPVIGLSLSLGLGQTYEEVSIIYNAFKSIGYEIKEDKDVKQKERLVLIVGSKG